MSRRTAIVIIAVAAILSPALAGIFADANTAGMTAIVSIFLTLTVGMAMVVDE